MPIKSDNARMVMAIWINEADLRLHAWMQHAPKVEMLLGDDAPDLLSRSSSSNGNCCIA